MPEVRDHPPSEADLHREETHLTTVQVVVGAQAEALILLLAALTVNLMAALEAPGTPEVIHLVEDTVVLNHKTRINFTAHHHQDPDLGLVRNLPIKETPDKEILEANLMVSLPGKLRSEALMLLWILNRFMSLASLKTANTNQMRIMNPPHPIFLLKKKRNRIRKMIGALSATPRNN